KLLMEEMVMNYTKNIAAALFVAIGLGSRNPALLDRDPDFKYTEETFWQTEETADAALNGIYAVLTSGGLFGGDATPLWEEGATPNAYCYSGGTQNFDLIGRSQQSASTGGVISSRWKECYKGIARANTFFERVGDVGMDEEKQSQMEGEAYFLRGLLYFQLVTYYGGVPLILEAPDPDTQIDQPRNEREEVIQRILTDLETAAERLPITQSGANVGRATKGAALSLKARVLLYEASPLLNESNNRDKWQAAADAAKEVMDLANEAEYDLYADYRGLFLPENENNQE